MITQTRDRSIERAIEQARGMGRSDDRLTRELDAALTQAFWDAQGRIGIETGELKASGRVSSSSEEDGDWHGQMSWRAEHALWHYQSNAWTDGSPVYEAMMQEAIERGIGRAT